MAKELSFEWTMQTSTSFFLSDITQRSFKKWIGKLIEAKITNELTKRPMKMYPFVCIITE